MQPRRDIDFCQRIFFWCGQCITVQYALWKAADSCPCVAKQYAAGAMAIENLVDQILRRLGWVETGRQLVWLLASVQ